MARLRPGEMPTFADGIKLAASDLNVISNAQAFLNNGYYDLNFPFEYLKQHRNVYFVHRFRYLHWRTQSTTTAHLMINGVSAGAVAQGATSGAVNLGFDYSEFNSNPYNLTLHRPYAVQWAEADAYCTRLYEHQSASGNLSLPAGVPTFAGIVSANTLNNVGANCKYLIDTALDCPVPVYMTRSYLPSADDRRYFAMYRKHNFLCFKGRYVPNGSDGIINGVVLRVNDVQIWSISLNGNAEGSWDIMFGFGGGPQFNYGGTGTLLAVNVNPTGFYEIQVKVANEEGHVTARMYNNLLCESPYSNRL